MSSTWQAVLCNVCSQLSCVLQRSSGGDGDKLQLRSLATTDLHTFTPAPPPDVGRLELGEPEGVGPVCSSGCPWADDDNV